MNSISFTKNTPVDFTADYSEKQKKSSRRFKILCFSNPIGWVFGILYTINKLFKKGIRFLTTPSLFGSSKERGRRSSSCLSTMTQNYNGKELVLKTPDGRKLEAWHFQGNSNKTVILFTGSHRSFEIFASPMVDAYQKKGFNVLCVNYGGFGKSEGSPHQEGIELDAETAYQYIKKTYSTHDIHAHGYSLGSFPATYLAKNYPLKKVVIDRGFSKLSHVAKDTATKIAGKIAGYIFYGIVDYAAPLNNTKGIGNIPSDLLYARGVHDDVMKPYHEDHFKKHSPKSTFLEANSEHHHFFSVWFEGNSTFWDWINKSS